MKKFIGTNLFIELWKGTSFMRQILFFLGMIFLALTATAYAAPPNSEEFQQILNINCSKCHDRIKIDQAMAERRDLAEIQRRMVTHGAELNAREQLVMGIFFRNPDKAKVPESNGAGDPLADYRAVLNARCSGCHSLDIVEAAMRDQRDFDPLAQMMIKRGAVINKDEMKIIKTFWGQPFR
jgi:cytochrome c5